MDKYIKFKLKPGQSSPDDGFSTGITISRNNIVWKAPEGTVFPQLDPHSKQPLEYSEMTSEEIEEYNNILNSPADPAMIEPMIEEDMDNPPDDAPVNPPDDVEIPPEVKEDHVDTIIPEE